jgi:cytochrome P450
MALMAEEFNVPDHVPPHLVYDFHFFGDAKYASEPQTRIQEILRDAPPVFWSPRGGCWYVARYGALVEAFKAVEVFSNVSYPGVPDDFVYMPYPLMTDPPKHAIYAAPLKAAFSPQSMAKLEGPIRKLAVELIDGVVEEGRCEFIDAIAEPLPIMIFLSIMGLPLERFAEFRKLAVEYLGAPFTPGKVQEVDALLCEFIEERRKRPREDLLSRLWSVELNGKPITMVDMRRYALMLFAAGLDSVTNGMGHSMHHLATDRGLQQQLRQNPGEIFAATEELLRRYGVTTPPRRILVDTEFHGAPLKADDRAELFVIAGNLDAEAFEDPAEVKLRRDRTHLTFGFGVHRCIGAHLARIELHILYEEWLKRLPEVCLDPRGQVTFDPGHVMRITNLPLVWDRA